MYTRPLVCIMRNLLRKLLANFLTEEYDRGWKDGVNQHRYEPKSAMHGYVDPIEYWGLDHVHMWEEEE